MDCRQTGAIDKRAEFAAEYSNWILPNSRAISHAVNTAMYHCVARERF